MGLQCHLDLGLQCHLDRCTAAQIHVLHVVVVVQYRFNHLHGIHDSGCCRPRDSVSDSFELQPTLWLHCTQKGGYCRPAKHLYLLVLRVRAGPLLIASLILSKRHPST